MGLAAKITEALLTSMCAEGLTDAQMAERVGVSRVSIWRAKKRLGLIQDAPKAKATPRPPSKPQKPAKPFGPPSPVDLMKADAAAANERLRAKWLK